MHHFPNRAPFQHRASAQSLMGLFVEIANRRVHQLMRP